MGVWTEEAKIAYAAGLFDGEGSVSIMRQHRGFKLYVQLGQSIKGWIVLDFLRDNFGAKVSNDYQQSGNRALKRMAFWTGNEACRFLKKIRPYLQVKGVICDLGFGFQDMNNTRSGVKWTTNEIEVGQWFFDEAKKMNAKGRGSKPAKEPSKTKTYKPEVRLFDLCADIGDRVSEAV